MGWQRQAHGPSVQQTLEDAVFSLSAQRVTVHAAGRTDAGVHALAMRAHFDLAKEIGAFRLMEAINALVGGSPVAVTDCAVVPEDWHARFSCVERFYEYRIVNRRAPLTIGRGLAWRVPRQLDESVMQSAAQVLVGRHDFTTFRSAHCQANSPIRTLDQFDVDRNGDTLAIRVVARSFLHHQVRSMVGCIALVGMGRWSIETVAKALKARNREALGLNAPAAGLYFVRARYPGE